MPLTTLTVASEPTIEHNDGAQPSQRKVRKSSAYARASAVGSIIVQRTLNARQGLMKNRKGK